MGEHKGKPTIPLIVGALLAALWVVMAVWLWTERERIIAARAAELDRLTVAVEEQTLRLFKLTEVSVLAVANWISEHPDGHADRDPAFERLLAELRGVSDGALAIRLLEPGGALPRASTAAGDALSAVLDAEKLRSSLDAKTHGILIGDPIVSPTNRKWIVPVTYPARRASGEPVLVAAVLELDWLARIFEPQRDKPNGSITLLTNKGITIFRTPAIEGAIGKSIAAAPDFIQHLSAIDRGQYRVRGAFDGVDRLISHSRLSSYPLIVAVTASIDDALVPWREEIVKLLAIALATSAVTIYVTRRFLRQEEETRRELAESEARFRSLTEMSSDFYWETDAEHRLTQRTESQREAAEKVLRQAPSIGSRRWEIPYLAPDEAAWREHRETLDLHLPFRNFEITRPRANGAVHHISVSGDPVFDADGNFTGYRGVGTDITVRKQMEERVRQLAFYDALTELPNRRLLNDRLSLALAASKRSGRFGALMFLDLDNFKPLNDHHGHVVGDMLLIEAAQRLKNCVREMDTVARLGGDEFVVMLGELSTDEAESTLKAEVIAEKIRTFLSAPYLLTVRQDDDGSEKTLEHTCTASIGVVLFSGSEATQDEILRWADTVMYQAKEAGRNMVRFHPRNGRKASLPAAPVSS